MTPIRSVARVASTERYGLGEGIIGVDGGVLWVDINAGAVLRGTVVELVEAGSTTRDITEYDRIHIDRTVGAVAPASDGGLLVAASRGLAVVSPAGVVSLGPDLLGSRENARLNDGAVDPQGRYLVGSLSLTEPTDQEVLLRVSSDGSVETLLSGISLSNGLGWSPDGSTLYFIDTIVKRLLAHPYSADGEWDPAAWVDVPCEFAGYPDGLEVDSAGTLWVAQWGAGVVQRFDASGTLLQTIDVGTPHVSCPGLIADGLLGITTSTDEIPASDTLAGALFTCEVDATPQATTYWSGSTTNPYWSNSK